MIEKRKCVDCSSVIQNRNKTGLCGACFKKPKIKAGDIFGRWTVKKEASRNLKKQRAFHCVCACGQERFVVGACLTVGGSKSCGCLAREIISESRRTHGMSKTRIYKIWTGMLTRCNNEKEKNYKHYGARGIAVCERWCSFENFLADMGVPEPGFEIDRIDVDGNYEPGNCRWATITQQARNRRNNHLITFDGKTQCLVEWANELGISTASLLERLEKWDVGRALTQKRRNQRRRIKAT